MFISKIRNKKYYLDYMVRHYQDSLCVSIFVITILLILSLHSQAAAWSGRILDSKTGTPVRGAVIVRSWTKGTAGPYGAYYCNYLVKETLSDAEGKFSLIGTIPVFLPIAQTVYEEKSVVYKAGYQFAILEGHPKKIELIAVPTLFNKRKQALEAIDQSHFWNEKYNTKLFLKSIRQEEEFLDLLKDVEDNFLPKMRASRSAGLSLTRKTAESEEIPFNQYNAKAIKPGFPVELSSYYSLSSQEKLGLFNVEIQTNNVADILQILENKNSSTGEILSAVLYISKHELRDAVPSLQNLLYHPEPLVNRVAISSLISLGHQFTTEEVEYYIADLYAERSATRYKARLRLSQIGEASVPSLLKVLKTDNEAARHESIEVLAKIKNPMTSKAIIDAFPSVSERTQLRIIAIFREYQDPAVTDILIDVLQNGSQVLQKRAIMVLGEMGNTKAVEPLSNILQMDNRELQRLAIRALGQIDDETALKKLKLFLHDRYNRNYTLKAITNFRSEETAKFLIGYMETISHNDIQLVARALSTIGTSAFSPIIAHLPHEKEEICFALVRALGNIGDRRATRLLLNMLKDNRSKVRGVVCRSLALLKDPRAIEPLFYTLDDDVLDVRQAAAKALVTIGSPCLKTLLKGLKNENPYLRWRAAWCLARLQDPRAYDRLVTSLGDMSSEVQWNVIFALGTIGKVKAQEPLEKLLDGRDIGLINLAKMMITEIMERADYQEKIKQRRTLFRRN